MNHPPADLATAAGGAFQPSVDWIVQEVMRRLRAGSGSGDGRQEEPTPQAATLSANTTAGELAVWDRVITCQSVQDRLDGVRRLVVPHRAVVTPAVRDELKRRGIELVVGQPPASSVAVAAPLLLIDETHGVDVLHWQRLLGPPIEAAHLTCRREIVSRISQWVDRGGRAVWYTERPASAVCRANAAGVRAYAAYDRWLWRDALTDADISVLVLDTRRSRPQDWAAWITMLRQHTRATASLAGR